MDLRTLFSIVKLGQQVMFSGYVTDINGNVVGLKFNLTQDIGPYMVIGADVAERCEPLKIRVKQ